MASPSPFDFSVPEAAIAERLCTELMTPGRELVRRVMTKAELADVPAEQQITPAAYVVYGGYTVAGAGEVADELSATLVHRWVVAIAVESAARIRESVQRHELGGPIIHATSRALHGWRPCVGFTKLALVSPPPPYYEGKYAYFPIAFTTRAIACAS